MPDATTRHDDRPQSGWANALARLPMEAPPADAWARIATSLDAAAPRESRQPQRARRAAGWLALAAVLALAVAVPWQRDDAPPADATPLAGTPSPDTDAQDTTGTPTLAELQAESAWLETLLAHARDGRVATGSAAAMAAELEARLAAIDDALADPTLDPALAHALWAERVEALQVLASFEGTRRWLAANGEQYDGVLVQVN